MDDRKSARELAKNDTRPQMIISLAFLAAYFLMLFGIFVVEISDDLNMDKGDNSMLQDLEILIGVLTAEIPQILSFWFGGLFGSVNKAKA